MVYAMSFEHDMTFRRTVTGKYAGHTAVELRLRPALMPESVIGGASGKGQRTINIFEY